jgi:hypothetical protein
LLVVIGPWNRTATKAADMQAIYGALDSSLTWQKSSLCQNGECVEIAAHGSSVLMRNTSRPKDLAHFTATEFRLFLEAAKSGEFDLS